MKRDTPSEPGTLGGTLGQQRVITTEPGRAVIDDSTEDQVHWTARSGQHKTARLPRVIFSR